jgi:hypothetical protein
MLGSREFLVKRTGGDPQSWVRAAYPLLMGRAPDPAGLTYWAKQASLSGPERAATRLLASPEARRFRIRTTAASVEVLGGPPEVWMITDGLRAYDAGGWDGALALLLADDAVYLHAQRTHRQTPS